MLIRWGGLLGCRHGGKSSNFKDEEQLSQRLLVVLPITGLGVGHILFIDSEESWAMQNGQQRLPFLEEEIWTC